MPTSGCWPARSTWPGWPPAACIGPGRDGRWRPDRREPCARAAPRRRTGPGTTSRTVPRNRPSPPAPAPQETTWPVNRTGKTPTTAVRHQPPRAILTGMAGKPAKADKEAQKAAKREKRAASRMRYKQLWQAFQHQRREDKLLLPLMIGSIVLASALAFGIGLFFGMEWVLLPLGIAVGLLGAVSIFGRRVQSSVYAKADGQPGAAGWALDNMRGSWRVSQGIAGNTHLDAVHRVIGRPGVILVAEGAPHRVKSLLAQEKKRTSRVVGSTPIYDFVVGNDEGQTPLRDLQKTLTKLPRNISTNQMEDIEKRLAALGSRAAALPKGPLPSGAKMRSVQRTVRRR